MGMTRENWRERWPALAGAADAIAGMWQRQSLYPSHECLKPEDLCGEEMLTCDVDGRRIAYTDNGSGEETFILVHGFAGSHQTWSTVQALLGERYRVICPDLLGFGGSERPATLTPMDWTNQLIGLMDTLAITNAVLAGHSVGGRVALTCSATVGHRVRGVALLGSDGAQTLSRYPFLWAMARTPLLRKAIERLAVSRDDVLKLLRASYSETFPITEAMITAYQRPLCVRGTYAALRHLGQVYPDGNLTSLLPRVTCPVTLVWGEQDRVTPVRAALDMLAVLPATSLLILPDVGHLPQEECPRQVADHLDLFLTRLP